MRTVIIQIGNSDDKLSQRQWSEFVVRMGELIHRNTSTVHFHGYSPCGASWQNAAWIFELGTNDVETGGFKDAVEELRQRFHQDSVAFTVGKTEFV